MDTGSKRAVRHAIVALLLAGGLGGCAVYAPPYAGYAPAYYSDYAYPTYVAPPVFLDFGFYQHRHYGHYRGGYYGHGWGHGSGWGGGRSWGYWRGGRH